MASNVLTVVDDNRDNTLNDALTTEHTQFSGSIELKCGLFAHFSRVVREEQKIQ